MTRADQPGRVIFLTDDPAAAWNVATLNDAQDWVAFTIGEQRIAADPRRDQQPAWDTWDNPDTITSHLTAEGGTIGPLPDGTTITATPITWTALAQDAGAPEETRHVTGAWDPSYLRWHRNTALAMWNKQQQTPVR